MSGRKQHFIQRLLLKGFSVDPSAKTPQIWVYRHDGRVFQTSLERYAAERDFYGHPDESDLDADLTEMESDKFNGFLESLRTGEDRAVDAGSAATFAVQVFARSKNLRAMITAGIEPMIARATAVVQTTDFQVRMLVGEIRRNPSEFLGRMLSPTEIVSALSSPAALERVARFLVERSKPQTEAYLTGFHANVREMVAATHNQSLRDRLADFGGTRRDQLRTMHWHRVTVPSEDLVLGDSVVTVELVDGRFKPVTEPGDELAHVWLPIASGLILMASFSERPPAIDTGNVNRGAASCSFDAFCANQGPTRHETLWRSIRTGTFSLSDKQADQVIADSLQRLLQ